MKDQAKAKQVLIQELVSLRHRISELEHSESERKQVDEHILVSNERLQYLLSSTSSVIYTSKPSGDYGATFISENVVRMVGYNPEEFIRDSNFWFDHVHPEDQPIISEEVPKIFEKEFHAYEYRFRCKDGRYIWVIDQMKMVRDNDGNPTEIIGIRLDITKRKQAEEALEQAVREWQGTFDATNDAIWILDQDQRVSRSNKTAERFFHRPRGEIIGKHCYEILHGKAQPIPDCPIIRVRKSLRRETTELQIGESWFFVVVDPILDEAGQYSGTVHIVSDITERKKVDEQLHASLREKDVLLNEIHHRVKNNLQVICGLLDLQARTSKNPEVIESFHESQDRIRAMAMVHEKLYHSKDFSGINLAGYVRSLSEELFQSHNINPGKIDLTIQTNGKVYMDINKAIPCGLILNELISNALKHAFPGDGPGKLQIIIRETKETEIEIVVRDNGLGLPDDVDIHEPRSVGLHLVNGLVKNQLDGQMEVRRDSGTEFRITFPL